jgi:hypothetical protein
MLLWISRTSNNQGFVWMQDQPLREVEAFVKCGEAAGRSLGEEEKQPERYKYKALSISMTPCDVHQKDLLLIHYE